MTQEDVIKVLDLKPLPQEGGYYRETFRSSQTVEPAAIGGAVGQRNLGTAIFYFLTPDQFSALHRLKYAEIFHFYLGDPVEMTQIDASGKLQIVTLGQDILSGQQVQAVVAPDTWQGTKLKTGGKWALLGTTMAPGFDFADFELADANHLSTRYPAHSPAIRGLCR